MNIFRKKSNEPSNDYYNAYKEELMTVKKKEGFFSLNTIIKIETTILISGLIFMGYSNFFTDFSKNFSLEFNKNSLISQSILSSSSDKMESKDSELIIQLEESETDTILPINIKEEKQNVYSKVEMLAKKLKMNSDDLSLIVEVIKSEMSPKIISKHEDKIMIGQL